MAPRAVGGLTGLTWVGSGARGVRMGPKTPPRVRRALVAAREAGAPKHLPV
jgi:hypothetical protein